LVLKSNFSVIFCGNTPSPQRLSRLQKRSLACSHVGLLCLFDFSDFLASQHHVLVLDAHNTSRPLSSEFFVVVELLGEVLGEVLEVLEVFLVNLS